MKAKARKIVLVELMAAACWDLAFLPLYLLLQGNMYPVGSLLFFCIASLGWILTILAALIMGYFPRWNKAPYRIAVVGTAAFVFYSLLLLFNLPAAIAGSVGGVMLVSRRVERWLWKRYLHHTIESFEHEVKQVDQVLRRFKDDLSHMRRLADSHYSGSQMRSLLRAFRALKQRIDELESESNAIDGTEPPRPGQRKAKQALYPFHSDLERKEWYRTSAKLDDVRDQISQLEVELHDFLQPDHLKDRVHSLDELLTEQSDRQLSTRSKRLEL